MTLKKFYTIIWIIILVFILIDFIWNQINIANLNNLEKIIVKVEEDEKLYVYSFKKNSYSQLGERKYNKISLSSCHWDEKCKNPNNKNSYWYNNGLYYKNKEINNKYITAYSYYWSKDWNYYITVMWLFNGKPAAFFSTLRIINTKTWRVYIVNTKEDKFHHIEKIVWYIE